MRFRVAGRLPIGKPLPPHLFEVAVGIILGDGQACHNRRENASLHVEQSMKSESYLLHLYELFKDYTKNPPKIRNRFISEKTRKFLSRFTTR